MIPCKQPERLDNTPTSACCWGGARAGHQARGGPPGRGLSRKPAGTARGLRQGFLQPQLR